MYAIVDNGIVINVVVWDGGDSWEPPAGATAIEVTAQTGAAYIGGAYSNGAFAAPAAPESTSS
ncbi:hypothetical protein [Paraburkholderia tropica]|uniref:hypothetical protein n=1 Tax=Paraburkholderia tropica TaxID=92647 RepID=UPI003D294B8C